MTARLPTAQWWVLRDAFNTRRGLPVRKSRRRAAKKLIRANLLKGGAGYGGEFFIWITDAGRDRVLREADTILTGPYRNQIAQGRRA